MNTTTNRIVSIIHRLAVITMVASFALVSTASAQMETHNPYTVRGLQIRTNLIPEETASAYSTMEVDEIGPTLFQEMVPCRFVSTLDRDQYPVRWGGFAFQVSESRIYHPIGYLVEDQFRNPCSELIPSTAVALSLRIASYQPQGNGSVYLAPAAVPNYNRAALLFKQNSDTQQEANVILEDQAFVVTVADQATELTIDIIGYFIPDPLVYAAKGDKGDRGERGERGEMGPAGPQGNAGAAGERGEKGEKGDKGDAGVAGAQGAKGDKGDAGVAGAQGEKGDKGDAGVAGAQGEKGDKGDAGVAGARGEKGDKGDAGAQGAQGPMGPMGPQGPQGEQGPQGVPGLVMYTGTSTFPPPGSITINHSKIRSDSVIILIYTEVSNGNALGVASQKAGSFVASGSPNKPFKYIILNAN